MIERLQRPTRRWGAGVRTATFAGLLVASAAGDVFGQQQQPVGPFVIDAHVALPSFSSDDTLADPLGLRSDQLPERGRGWLLGAHVYPVRGRRVTLGLGASLMRAKGSLGPAVDALPTDPTVESRIAAFTPQVSLNFGSARGWSYISAGYGRTSRSTGRTDDEVADGTGLNTLSYGGGARWFLSTHVAFSFDLRFYRLPTQVADGSVPDQPGYTMFVGSAGVSFK
jgi:hypothetical protein